LRRGGECARHRNIALWRRVFSPRGSARSRAGASKITYTPLVLSNQFNSRVSHERK
jgi:hypothetical protein